MSRRADPAQIALFTIEELTPEAPPPSRPPQWAGFPEGPARTGDGRRTGPCLYGSPVRGRAARVAEYELWTGLYGTFGCAIDSHAWRPAIYRRADATLDRHEPYLLDCDLRQNQPAPPLPPCGHTRPLDAPGCGILHRSACFMPGCDWEGPERTGENEAVEDGMDHAWPGWRDLPPVLRTPDVGGNPNPTGKLKKTLDNWVAKVNAVYPEFWLENGGPIRTVRDRPGTRHVEASTPWGGYDLSISTEAAKILTARLAAAAPPGQCWECDNGGHVCERCRKRGEHGRSWHVTCPS